MLLTGIAYFEDELLQAPSLTINYDLGEKFFAPTTEGIKKPTAKQLKPGEDSCDEFLKSLAKWQKYKLEEELKKSKEEAENAAKAAK